MRTGRRLAAALAAALALALAAAAAAVDYPPVTEGTALRFPHDHGSHPRFRTEWWYVTGWLRASDGSERGMQITFFRNRPGIAEDVPGALAARQLVFAHAALADPANGRLLHDQRAARAGLGLADAREGGTDVAIGDWSLKQTANGYAAEIAAREFRYSLTFEAREPLMLNGDRGVSRKGPRPGEASYYYSRPHLDVVGTVTVGGRAIGVRGEAWLDHEWSSEYLAPEAAGWDWIGINIEGGGALMAFRIRDKSGAKLWAGGTLRGPDRRARVLAPEEVDFTPLKRWRSPRTRTEYPVAMRVRAGDLRVELQPLMDDQELDARASTGTVYWEGAVRASADGRPLGLGYLELTGYGKPLKLQ
ncbi:MAG TPA: lipocalin-like domain-containing protein [Burkholderiales bacterium]|nr:lipocalin-like domain-containing protein [Burkholderiales bacterium]